MADLPQLPTLVPAFVAKPCAEAIAFYERALGAKVLLRMDAPDGQSVWHVHLQVGDSHFFMGDPMPPQTPPPPTADRPSPMRLFVNVPDCDAAHRRAIEAGARSAMEPADMFWGDRLADVVDPFGYKWTFCQHVKDMSPEEMKAAGEAFARKWASSHRG